MQSGNKHGQLPNPANFKPASHFLITYRNGIEEIWKAHYLYTKIKADSVQWGTYFVRLELRGQLVVAIRCELIIAIDREEIKEQAFSGLQSSSDGGPASSFLAIE